ncbi:MAG: cytidine deaminase [Prevotellaceae bacterium]|jgi:cytidine deaminase|nr:cytidine deaminase [Prevotellaceae bacterium]
MKQFEITVSVKILTDGELNETERRLIESASAACSNAYSPYSKFSVGAAVLLSGGEIICGSNQENDAFPSGMCAERVALFYANSQRPASAVVAVAITSAISGVRNSEYVYPCGACRQSLLQSEIRFGNRIKILMANSTGVMTVESAGDLLPLNFKM